MSRARTLCPDCNGLGDSVQDRKPLANGTYYVLGSKPCPTCKGTGHLDPKKYAGKWVRGNRSEDGVSAASLGKLLGVSGRPKRTERP